MVRRMAQHFGAASVTISEPFKGSMQEFLDAPDRMLVLDLHGYEDDQPYKFRKEIPVAEGESRQYRYFDVADIFPTDN